MLTHVREGYIVSRGPPNAQPKRRVQVLLIFLRPQHTPHSMIQSKQILQGDQIRWMVTFYTSHHSPILLGAGLQGPKILYFVYS